MLSVEHDLAVARLEIERVDDLVAARERERARELVRGLSFRV